MAIQFTDTWQSKSSLSVILDIQCVKATMCFKLNACQMIKQQLWPLSSHLSDVRIRQKAAADKFCDFVKLPIQLPHLLFKCNTINAFEGRLIKYPLLSIFVQFIAYCPSLQQLTFYPPFTQPLGTAIRTLLPLDMVKQNFLQNSLFQYPGLNASVEPILFSPSDNIVPPLLGHFLLLSLLLLSLSSFWNLDFQT